MFYFILGAIIGSFLNVVILRVPNNKSIIKPRSNCPNCKHLIPFYYNIPIISYLLLKGRCANCQETISTQYILVEIITGFIFYYTFITFSFEVAILYAAVYSCLIALAFIDFSHLIIPLHLIIILYISMIIKTLFFNLSILEMLMGSVSVASYLIFSAMIIKFKKNRQQVLGFGDVLLSIFIGGFLGIVNGLICLFLSSLIGLVFVVFMKSEKIPFGTCIAISFFVISIIEVFYDIKSLFI